MRTDVKIGVVVGLVIIIAAFLYFKVFDGTPQQPPPPTPREMPPTDIDEIVRMEDEKDTSVAGEGPGGVDAARDEGTVPVDKVRDTGTGIGPGLGPDDSLIAAVGEGAITRISPRDSDVPIAADSGDEMDTGVPREISPTPGIGEAIPVPVADDTATGQRAWMPARGGKTHVIRSGESLWVIAEKEYGPGSGKHWPKIQAANPDLNPDKLPVGKAIRIPVLTLVTKAPSVGRPSGAADLAAASLGGGKTYVVVKDDSLWKIAARRNIYADGAQWKRIQKANPGINPDALTPGMRLIIPPLSSLDAPGIGSAVRPLRELAPMPGLGQKVYVVQKGDSGMWAVSVTHLGDGKYWPAIARVNRGANPSVLRPGQKLVIPSLQEAKKLMSGHGGRLLVGTSERIPASTAAPAGDGEPVFD